MSRNAISANPEHYIFNIFWESMPPDPPGRPKNKFSRRRVAQKFFFRIDFPPKQKSWIEPWAVTSYLSENEAENLQNGDVHLAQITDFQIVYLENHLAHRGQ